MPKRKSQLEKTIQSSIQAFLELQEELGNLVYQKNNTGAVRINRPGAKSSFMRFGKKGSPDFLVWQPDWNASELISYFIEVKTDVGVLSKDQREFKQKVESLGGHYHIVRSLEEVKKILDRKFYEGGTTYSFPSAGGGSGPLHGSGPLRAGGTWCGR